jgi:hypothetical protein
VVILCSASWLEMKLVSVVSFRYISISILKVVGLLVDRGRKIYLVVVCPG